MSLNSKIRWTLTINEMTANANTMTAQAATRDELIVRRDALESILQDEHITYGHDYQTCRQCSVCHETAIYAAISHLDSHIQFYSGIRSGLVEMAE